MNLDLVFDVALSDLADGLGLSDRVFDENGVVVMEEGTTHPITLRKDDERKSLLLTGIVWPDFSAELRRLLAEDLLELALSPLYANTPCIGLDERTHSLMAYQVVPVEEILPQGRLAEFFADFIDYLNAIEALVAEALEENRAASAQQLEFALAA